jgi:hypothetical protein
MTAPRQAAYKRTWGECSRCGGTGRIAGYDHIDHGICWGCEGKGKRFETEEDIDKAAEVARALKQRTEKEAYFLKVRKHYAKDRRLGPRWRAKMQEYPAVERETLRSLWKMDNRGLKAPWLLENWRR